MSEPLKYKCIGEMVQRSRCGGGNWVSILDYDDAQVELAALREELADMQHWRDLALQFDNHRMNAMWHLKTLVSDGAHYDAARDFLNEPPIPASELQQRLTAAEQRNAELAQLLFYASERLSKVRYVGLHKRIKAALNPTESGASE